MSNNRDLLKEAIADAKAVKETAIANAKAALEEAFTPHLKSMLSAKLEEMDKDVEEDNMEEAMDSKEEDKMEEGYGMKSYEDDDSMEEDIQEDEVDEEINLDELLAELNEEEDDKKMEESEITEAEEELEEDVTEEEVTEEEEEDEADMEGEEEEIDLEDMSEDDLKSFIEDVIKDMVDSGELEAGDEFESDEDEEEVEVEDDMEDTMMDDEDLEEGAETASYDFKNPTAGPTFGDNDNNIPNKTGKATGPSYANKPGALKLREEEELEESALGVAAIIAGMGIVGGAAEALKRYLDKNPKAKEKFLSATGAAMKGSGKSGMMEEVEELKQELQEVNLLNAKLLYTNKIFKTKNLSEDKKVKVLKAFDKAETVKEAKVIFETLNEGMINKSKTIVNEVKGSASKATGTAPAAKQTIVESDAMVERFKKLAGIL
jgi:hypothetical protein